MEGITGKAHGVAVVTKGLDRDSTPLPCKRGVQGALYCCGTRPEGDRATGVCVACMGETQTELAAGFGSAVNTNALLFSDCLRAVLHHAIAQGRIEGDQFVGQRGFIKITDKAHHIALGATEAGIKLNQDVALGGFQQRGVGSPHAGHGGGRVSGEELAAPLDRRSAGAFDLNRHEVDGLTCQRTTKVHGKGVGSGDIDIQHQAADAAKTGLKRGLDGSRVRATANQARGIGLTAMVEHHAEAFGDGFAPCGHPVLMRYSRYARLHRAQRQASVIQICSVKADRRNILICEGTRKADVQPKLSAAGRGGVEADIDIAAANAGQGTQGVFHALGQGCAISGVGNRCRGLATKAKSEAAGRDRRTGVKVDLEPGQIHPRQPAAKGDVVHPASAGHFNCANTAQGRIQGKAQCCRVGTKLYAGGGVSLTTMAQTQ